MFIDLNIFHIGCLIFFNIHFSNFKVFLFIYFKILCCLNNISRLRFYSTLWGFIKSTQHFINRLPGGVSYGLLEISGQELACSFKRNQAASLCIRSVTKLYPPFIVKLMKSPKSIHSTVTRKASFGLRLWN